MSVNEKMTAIANEIRELSGTTNTLGLDDMATNIEDANDEVALQQELISQAVSALEGKVAGGGNNTDVDVYEGSYEVTPKTEAQTLYTAHKMMADNVIIEKIPSSYITPSGTKSITTNGTYDVKAYASVNVNVSSGTGENKLAKLISGKSVAITAVDLAGATAIGEYAFYHCMNLSSINIPNGVNSIGQYAFYSCQELTSINIPGSVASIGDSAFYQCTNLPSINIPNGVTSIAGRAFGYCMSLTSINIPASVASIGSNAFYYCTALQECDCSHCTSVPHLLSQAFRNCPDNLKIKVPTALYDQWIAATNWSDYASYIVAV